MSTEEENPNEESRKEIFGHLQEKSGKGPAPGDRKEHLLDIGIKANLTPPPQPPAEPRIVQTNKPDDEQDDAEASNT